MNFEGMNDAVAGMNVPLSLIMDQKIKTTLSVPESLNEKVEKLSKDLDMTKSLLFVVGMLMLLKFLDDADKKR
jgi:hypothetical protein